MLISGTASVAEDGTTAYVGDVTAQVKRTMEVVEALLGARDMEWPHVVRALAYFKRPGDSPALAAYCADHGLTDLPIVVAHNDVCRDDLLFEIEVDAILEEGDG